MGEVHVTWLQDLQFVGTDSTRHSLVMSPPGDNSVGMKPSELLLMALAGCTGVDVANILRKKRVQLNHLRISVSGEQDPTPPWAFRKMHIHYQASGKGLTSEAMEQAIRLSEEKYCSVAATFQPSVELTRDFELVQIPTP
jgi:putative redox protein